LGLQFVNAYEFMTIDTTSLTLKEAIQSLLIKYQLLLSKVRGQISIDEVNTELFRCMSSFSPANFFSAFNVENLINLARFYPHDFDFKRNEPASFLVAPLYQGCQK